MTAKEILVPLAMVLLTVTLSAIINTKIKFAQTAAHAISDIKKTLLYLVFFGTQVYFAFRLGLELSSDAPLTRGFLALILMYSFGLFHTYLMYWFFRLSRTVDRTIDIIDRLADQTIEHVKITKELASAKDSQPNKSPEPTVVGAVSASEKSRVVG